MKRRLAHSCRLAAAGFLISLIPAEINAQSRVNNPVVTANAPDTPNDCGWTNAAAYPIPVRSQAVTSVGGNIYSFGGISGNPTSASYKFDGSTWTSIASLPRALEGPRAVNDGINIYILGGGSFGTLYNTLYKYDPAADTYTTLAPFTTATDYHTAVYLNGKIYKFGGFVTNGSTNALEIYDVATDTWTKGANYPLSANQIAAFIQGNFIYASGGHLSGGPGMVTAKTYRYDPLTDSWDDAAIADLPDTRWGAAAAFYGGRGLLAGGYVAGDFSQNLSASVIAWDPASNTWSTLPKMLQARAGMDGAVLNGSFYVIGGGSSSGETPDNQRLPCLPDPPTPRTIRVPADQPTIQQAISFSVDGDVVLVSPGTYLEHLDFHGKAISVQSAAGSEATIIDGSNNGSVVSFHTSEGAKSVLSGFTIQHGNASFGAGIDVEGASPTITRNIFRENHQQAGGFGAAIGGNNASPVIEGNTFVSNTCDTQFSAGVASFVNSSSPHIYNNIFTQNPCRAINMSLPLGTSPVVANNTFIQNSVAVTDGGPAGSSHFYANNILVSNTVGYQMGGPGPATWQNNLVYSNGTDYSGISNQTGLNGNISADPAFVSASNFRLKAGSPAIDAGTASVPNLPATDFARNPRVFDGDGNGSALPDIGAFEYPTFGSVANVSTRLSVGANDNVFIEGFIVQGPADSIKKIVVRAIGPSLSSFGVADALPNPTLEVHDASGVIARNNDWKITQVGGIVSGSQSAEIAASGLAPSNDLESAVIANLAPGSYTAVVQGAGGATGTGVVDAFDLSASSTAKLANIATRGLVQPGDKLMIAGFIIQNGSVRVVVRATGPSLIQSGINNALPDTTLQLRDGNGAIVRENDDWMSDQKAELEATGLQPTNALEAALIQTIPPGSYTAQVRGKPETTGIGVVEVYFLQ